MTTADIREAVRRARGRATVEISGGVTLARVPELASTGADSVSVGALTHSAPAADISLEIERSAESGTGNRESGRDTGSVTGATPES
jgi:nicotinate-nucleotide pyrophosphorylase (carboxylating)